MARPLCFHAWFNTKRVNIILSVKLFKFYFYSSYKSFCDSCTCFSNKCSSFCIVCMLLCNAYNLYYKERNRFCKIYKSCLISDGTLRFFLSCCTKCGRSLLAGPLITFSSSVYRLPWQGQSQVLSSLFHLTMHPKCMHSALTKVNLFPSSTYA